MENQVREGDRVDQVGLLAAPERLLAQEAQLLGGRGVAQAQPHVVEGLGQEAAGAAARVVDRLAHPRVDHPDHRADHLAGREELAAVVVLLAHLQEQALVGLAQHEEVGLVHRLHADLVDAVQDVQQVLLRVHRDLVERADDLADHPLAGRRAGHVAQPAQVGKQRAVHEGEIGAHRRVGQLDALRPARRGPVAPAERRLQRRRERDAERRGFLRFDLLALVEDPQEEDPRQLGHVLEGARVVRAPHDVGDLLDRRVHGRRAGKAAGGGRGHQLPFCGSRNRSMASIM